MRELSFCQFDLIDFQVLLQLGHNDTSIVSQFKRGVGFRGWKGQA